MASEVRQIYVAGPLFTIQDRDYLVKIGEVVRAAGKKPFLPHVDNNDNADGRGVNTSRKMLDNIFRSDYLAIEKSDAIIALLDGVPVDCGTAWELGYAFARAKPILGLRTDFRILGNFEEQRIDLMVESACNKFLFVPAGNFVEVEKGILDFLRSISK